MPREKTGSEGGGPALIGTTTEFMAAATTIGGRAGGRKGDLEGDLEADGELEGDLEAAMAKATLGCAARVDWSRESAGGAAGGRSPQQT